ncbi:MAG: LysM peptidoglycan-binding domain-containing protein [Chitinophagaceae bacterium]
MKQFFLLMITAFITLFSNAQNDVLIVKKGEKSLFLEHKVLAKEGLYSIGRLYNVSPKHIASFNKMDMNKGLEIDQVLMVPLSDTNFTQKSTSGTPVYYHVVSGDGLIKVSVDHNNVPMKSIREWNALPSDNINEGANLIIGFLISKEMVAYLANIRAKNMELAKKAALENPVVKPEETTVAKQDPPKTQSVEPPVIKTEPITNHEAILEEKKKAEPPKVVAAVVKEEVKPLTSDNSYFKFSFDQQVKAKPIAKNSTVTSGIFKTTSGWQDTKYYMLIDGVSPGTIIKIINPDNNKSVYAKVLGEMNGIRQNQGLDIRISNAAASALQVGDEDKFVVKVNY